MGGTLPEETPRVAGRAPTHGHESPGPTVVVFSAGVGRPDTARVPPQDAQVPHTKAATTSCANTLSLAPSERKETPGTLSSSACHKEKW